MWQLYMIMLQLQIFWEFTRLMLGYLGRGCRKRNLIDEVGGMWRSTAAGCDERFIPNC